MRVQLHVLNIHGYNFSTLALAKGASSILHNIEPQNEARNGTEVCRRLCKHTFSNSEIRRHVLRDEVISRETARGIAETRIATEHWEATLRESLCVGASSRMAIKNDVLEDSYSRHRWGPHAEDGQLH